MMLQLVVTFVLFFCSSSIYGQDSVNLDGVTINGKMMTTRNGRDISAYLGIPYAQPPIGPLRFKNPLPWEPEQDQVLMADTDGNECPQFNRDGIFIGDEDCLFLNVYSPKTTPEQLYPTMVFFHGGNEFLQGSGSSINAGPEYLLDRDIVLVTVNYRLGVLGFLSTGDSEAPGNFGLKDQVVALQWVQTNIRSFGGDPAKVTIFGQGAGGISTSLHAIYPISRDLFSQYISQSGPYPAYWSFQTIKTYKKVAYRLGSYLNCPIEDSKVLIDCLRQTDTYDLINSNDIFKDEKLLLSTWSPTRENAEMEGAFITDVPLHKVLKDGMKSCPAIIGDVFDEGLLYTAQLYTNDTLYNSMRDNLLEYVKFIVTLFFSDDERVAKRARDFYFGHSELPDKKTFIQNMTNLMSDAFIRVPWDLQLRVTYSLVEAPLYAYTFDYRGTFSKTALTLRNNSNVGVDHGDDLLYLFPMKTSNITMNESDNKMIDIMVDFWTSFADTGKPTSERISDPNVWKPFVYDAVNTVIKIGDNDGDDPLSLKEYPAYEDRLAFWDLMLEIQLQDFLTLE